MKKNTKKNKPKARQKTCTHCIVKRHGRMEEFDERKVYATCYRACKDASLDDKKAEKICSSVATQLKKWAGTKKCVMSDAIFAQLARALRKHDKNAAFMYETHRDIC
ncbi:MAG: ATP cone domain-containing protein [Candidatus Woesearchaeota archaeon]|nr:ATP cone domain-containing protein [Candidatus Woesearchaeota archaeon]